ncbi:MAG: SDR family NAD(P)-dependent oxidoreductase [Haloferacaceae archaeon]
MGDHGVYDELDGATALVTGSSRNLGRSIAEAFGAVGMHVCVHGRSDREAAEATASAVEEAGGAATVAMGDLADPAAIESVVDATRDAFGPVDVLVNNAAIRPLCPFEEITLEDWQRVHDVNLRAAFLLAQHVAPDMREREAGAVVNMLGQMALQGRREKAHVATTKTGLIGLTLTLAAELGPDGVRTNAVVPGRKIKTDHDRSNQRDLAGTQRKVEQATPLRRRGEPAEVARAVRFLVSDEAAYVNGEVFNVDGGLNPIFDLENVDVE